ncbi:ZWICHEL kinesin-like calmodulin-binding protein, partial [Prunus dulcis]
MHSLEPSRPADFRERFLPTQPPFQAIPGPKRTTSLPSISPAPPQPPSATVVAGNFHETGRVRQFFLKFVGARSPSFLNQIDRVRHQELGRSAVEVRGIHHRANYSFRAKGKKDNCARHSPGVGHAQDLARISKWKLGWVLSEVALDWGV